MPCSGGLKSQQVMISTAPNWGGGWVGWIRSSVGILAAPFRPLYKSISVLSSPFPERLPYLFYQFSNHNPSFKAVIASYKPCHEPSSSIVNFFDFFLKSHTVSSKDQSCEIWIKLAQWFRCFLKKLWTDGRTS